MNKRYYKKKGPSYKERLRCPLCGKISDIGFFSQNHLFGIYRFRFAGRGNISCKLINKGATFMNHLNQSIAGRLKALLEQFTGLKYYSELEIPGATVPVAIKTTIKPRIVTKIVPSGKPLPIRVKANVIPSKVVIR